SRPAANPAIPPLSFLARRRFLYLARCVNPDDPAATPMMIRDNKLALVERLADDLAHEIKNPLHAMVINLEVLRRRIAARHGFERGTAALHWRPRQRAGTGQPADRPPAAYGPAAER